MRKTRFTQMIVLVCMGSLVGCTSSGEGGTAGNTELNVIIPNGSPALGPPGSGTTDPLDPNGSSAPPQVIDIQTVEYTINCLGTPQSFLDTPTPLPNDGAVQINGNLEVVDGRTDPQGPIPPEFGTARPGDGAEIWQGFMDLPIGDCTIQLRARDNDGEIICTAQEDFTIVTDTTSKVNLVLICDVSFQAPVGMLDVDATFSFVVGNFCPDLFVINCNPQDETVPIQDLGPVFGFQAVAGCQVRARDVDSTCGEGCDPQFCPVIASGFDDCFWDPDDNQTDDSPLNTAGNTGPDVTTTVMCASTVPEIPGIPVCVMDCEVDGVPNFALADPVTPCALPPSPSGCAVGDTCAADAGGPGVNLCVANQCEFTQDQLGVLGNFGTPAPGQPGPGGWVIAYTLCSQDIINATFGSIPHCSNAAQIGAPLYPGADCVCEAWTTDGDEDCNKHKDVTLSGPGDSPCVQAGCDPGVDCAFCDDGVECTENTCDDSSGAPVCPNDPRSNTTSCDEHLPALGLCSGVDGTCEIQGCNNDGDCLPPDPAACLGQATCNTTTLVCNAQPPGNNGGACDSGVGSGAGTCDAGGSCNTNDQCFVDATCGPSGNVCIADVCDQSGSPWVCDIDLNANDGDNCTDPGPPPVAGICDTGNCVLPPILDTFQGCTNTTYECFIVGTVSLTLGINAELCLDSPGTGLVTVDYDIRAEEIGTFLLAGVAADTSIIVSANIPIVAGDPCPSQPPLPPDAGCVFIGPTEIVTTVANGSATGALAPSAIQTNLDLGVPPLNLNNFLKVGNSGGATLPFVEIVLANAAALVPPIPNLCDGDFTAGGTMCNPGNIPPGWQPVVEGVLPDAAGTDVNFNVGGVNMVIAAVGGALILPVSTNDPTICDPALTVPGPSLDVPALAQ